MKIIFIILIFIFKISIIYSSEKKDVLTATIIGSGSPIYNENRSSACVLIEKGNTKILVDMGNGTQKNLNKLGIKKRKFTALLFTHHHLDHNEEFIPILISCILGRDKFSIIGPLNTNKYTKYALELYKEDIEYRLSKRPGNNDYLKNITVKEVKGGETFYIDDICIKTLKVPHTIYTVAYKFEYNNKTIVITGDLTYTSKLAPFAKNADIMIIDSGGMIMKNSNLKHTPRHYRKRYNNIKNKRSNKRIRAHLNLAESSLIAKNANIKILVYTHFTLGEVDEKESLKEIRKNYLGKVIFGKDLLELKNIIDKKIKENSNLKYNYPIVDTAQDKFYNNYEEIRSPKKGDDFYGQDAQFNYNSPLYTDNKNGTITDNNTNLMWQKGFKVLNYEQAIKEANSLTLGGYNDWRLPNIKEMYSLILFNGKDVSGKNMYKKPKDAKPFIDTNYFEFKYGANGTRVIDSQYLTNTIYKGLTMNKDKTVFGVNFADGRIKGYPLFDPRTRIYKKFCVKFVRGNLNYGINNFIDNNDGTITDLATGLMWSKNDSKRSTKWKDSFDIVQKMNKINYKGYSDWRIPNAKELQSIIDYSRCPQATDSAAIDPIFNITKIKAENGRSDYPYFYSSTTHLGSNGRADSAVYICFGEALGYMRSPRTRRVKLMDVHGAGAQRSDPKIGSSFDYPYGHGPQGDVIRIKNFIRLVRNVKLD